MLSTLPRLLALASGTYPAWLPIEFLRIGIDHVLTGPNIFRQQCRTGPDVGSDHLPVIADLVVLNR